MVRFKNKISHSKLFSNINDDFECIRKNSKNSLFIRLLFYYLTIFQTR